MSKTAKRLISYYSTIQVQELEKTVEKLLRFSLCFPKRIVSIRILCYNTI